MMKIYKISQTNHKVAYRYIHKDGFGLMNNQGLNRAKLSDDEEFELIEKMDFGLRQPPRDLWPVKGVFFFTEEGKQKHARLIELLKKASKSGVVEIKATYIGEPLWESSDGQIYLRTEQITYF